LTGIWGTYPWYEEYGTELIHPDDIEAFRQEIASGVKVFKCVGEGDYIILKYNNKCYRVKDKLFTPVPAPKYHFGETVSLKETGENAVITDIMWHYKNKKHYYFISVNGKAKTKRYFDTELRNCM